MPQHIRRHCRTRSQRWMCNVGNQVAGYDVTYEYANRTYRTRTDYHPGDRIRVRVDVQPE